MTSSRPYLIRALYQWIVDNGLTPYVLVNATGAGVRVPQQYVQNGKIVLNLKPTAVQGLSIENELIEFTARFAGAPMTVSIPPDTVLAIYAKENGQGMLFSEEDGDGGGTPEPTSPGGGPGGKTSRSHLKVVK
jgi:stringent starvation protein B